MNDDNFSLRKVSTEEITSVPSTELISAPSTEITSPASSTAPAAGSEIGAVPSSFSPQRAQTDPQAALRARIEAEELAKFQEEQMRAEIRMRMTGQQAPATPAPVIVNITNTSSSVSTATANVAAVSNVRQHPSTIIRLLYFLFIGWWAGFIWVGVALLLCISVIGLPIGLLMLSRALDSFIL
ncbi:YccF domain-containing protein [Deinococcus sp. LM3]|uniref:YccF domain-containing protein n=1 Tax=Deinococcus sp. LM3 TaxID=1938608 RepID=UPI00117E9A3F|nr:YccF domain-containing protein [Deinococcus sp. LM3]